MLRTASYRTTNKLLWTPAAQSEVKRLGRC